MYLWYFFYIFSFHLILIMIREPFRFLKLASFRPNHLFIFLIVIKCASPSRHPLCVFVRMKVSFRTLKEEKKREINTVFFSLHKLTIRRNSATGYEIRKHKNISIKKQKKKHWMQHHHNHWIRQFYVFYCWIVVFAFDFNRKWCFSMSRKGKLVPQGRISFWKIKEFQKIIKIG